MADKVYQLYEEQKRKPLTPEFLYDAFEEMKKQEPELIPYLEEIRILTTSKNLGNYVFEDHCVKVNRKLLEKNMPDNPQLLGIQVIKHEMEHARDLRTLEQGKDDIESLIVSHGLRYYAMNHGLDRIPNLDNLYQPFLEKSTAGNYETNPEERMAEIRACRYIVNMLKNQRTTPELLTARRMLYKAYISGYKHNGYYYNCPALEFLLKTGMFYPHNWLKNRIEKKGYCFDTRLLYGLPLTEKEYDQKILQKVKLRKRRVNE